MDPFNSSPAQPGSVMSSLLGGQTPASSSGLFGYGIGNPGSVLANNSIFNSNLIGSVGPNSILGGPGSILGGPNSVLGHLGGPGKKLYLSRFYC